MKKKLILITLGLSALIMTGCGTTDNEKIIEIEVPVSAKEFKKENYEDVETRLKKAGFENIEFKKEDDLVTGWLTKEGEVEKVSIEGITDFEAKDTFEKDAKVIITYHVFPEESSDGDKNTEVSTTQSSSAIQESVKESSEEKQSKKEVASKPVKDENITAANNEEFAHILNDSSDYEAFKKFAEKYQGKKIEFDANIAYMNLHPNKTTRYDFLIYAGDYSVDGSTGASGAPFQIRDKNVVSDFNFIGDNIPGSISEGLNIHLIAEVFEYDSRGDLLLIKPVETRIR
ncbi:DUF4839 domain-containing protein [Vagococcus fluvialis]|uniref:DUF4839 domain-containing protein n=1 Tax=Vagococcus fluvialis TaxID=2738 RepID=UPI001D09CFCD|nr:DUF4839 domain-containing protein [Vagococcus fluvialis]UDM80387.1 DUF4839 domain-containing protein [Vagococcus fluvialis]